MQRDGYSGKNPMELARSQLDFAALATGAPAVKDVLLKAQTMVPMAPPKPWGKISIGVGSAIAAALLVFAPLVPQQASYALLRVEFEQVHDPPQAMQLASEVVKHLPSEVTAGIEQQATRGSTVRPVMRLGVPGWAGSKLRRVAEEAFEPVAGEVMPLYYPVEEYQLSGRTSAWDYALGMFDAPDGPQYEMLGEYDEQADSLLELEPLLAYELKQRLAVDGHQLEALSFLPAHTASTPAGYDFTLPAWPLPVGVKIDGYAAQLDIEQSAIRAKAAELLEYFNLLSDEDAGDGSWGVVRVQVVDLSGRLNPQLTLRAQAAVEQPDAEAASRLAFDAEELALQAAGSVVPWAELSASSSRVPGKQLRYVVTVSLLGEQRRGLEALAAGGLERGENNTLY